MFCPKCRLLMFPTNGKLECRKCGYVKKVEKEERSMIKKREERGLLILPENIETMPKTKVNCPKCSNNEAYWVLRQMRAADEPATRIYRCTKCNHSWREN